MQSKEVHHMLKKYFQEMKIMIPAIYLALKDKETPIIAKLVAGLTVGYALSPIDLIPDFIPILGYLDDLIILPLLVKITLYFIPDEKMEQYKIASKNMWESGSPKKWYLAIPIVVIWILLGYFIYQLIMEYIIV
jgi:uncharacterized membrane protein YkvA (DUF1232 family)